MFKLSTTSTEFRLPTGVTVQKLATGLADVGELATNDGAIIARSITRGIVLMAAVIVAVPVAVIAATGTTRSIATVVADRVALPVAVIAATGTTNGMDTDVAVKVADPVAVIAA